MKSESTSSRVLSIWKSLLLGAIVGCSSCEPSFDQNVKRTQEKINILTQDIEKATSPEKIIACGRAILASVPANKYSERTYWVPENELPTCWSSLGLGKMLVDLGINGPGQGGPCLILTLKIKEEEIILFVYSQEVSPDPDVVKSPYSKKWRDGLYALYPVRP